MKILPIPAKNSNQSFPKRYYRPGDPLPPSHIRVDGRETLRRHAEAFEQHLRDEAARANRRGMKEAA